MQKGWYVVDPGTVIWNANMEMWMRAPYATDGVREAKIEQMKTWFLDEYGFDTTDEEIKQGCQWRRDFMYNLCNFVYPDAPIEGKVQLKWLINAFETGLVPVC
jgi:hypothetical protein